MKKNIVKTFGQYINEAKFHHSLPQGETRLRDQFRGSDSGVQGEIEQLASDLDQAGLLNQFKRTLSRFRSIEELKDAMMSAATSMDTMEEPSWNIRGSEEGGEETTDGGGYYYGPSDY
jgi:hypothetical protein